MGMYKKKKVFGKKFYRLTITQRVLFKSLFNKQSPKINFSIK